MGRWGRRFISKEVRKRAWDKTAGRCWYCGEDVTADPNFYRTRPNIEHLTPICEGGNDEIDNLVLACFGCNLNKRGRNLETYRKDIGESWAWSFENAAEQLAELREIWGSDLARGVHAVLLDVAAFCRRANFLFYGEQVGRPVGDDYQI